MAFTKRRKIILGICTSAAAILAGGGFAALILYAKQHSHDYSPTDTKDFTITFDPGEGRFENPKITKSYVYAGTYFDEATKPVAIQDGKCFIGWYDENDNPVMGRQVISKNITLTAKYTSSEECAFVKFEAGDSSTELYGNASIAVNKGSSFFMVNRPSVKNPIKHLLHWKFKTGEYAGQEIPETFVINDDIVLIPEMTNTISMTWNGCGATRTRGTATTTFNSGSKFKDLNQPCFEYGTKSFVGWYKDASYNTAWGLEEIIEANTTAYAKWADTPTVYSCSVTYKQKPGTTIVPVFSPSTSQLVSRTDKWSVIFKPTVSTSTGDYKVDHWEYSLDGSTSWTTITDDTTFDYDSVYIAPILTPNVEDVYVYGNTKVLTESTSKLNSYVLGCSTQDVTWKVYDDSSCAEGKESTVASIDTNGNLKVNFVGVENKKIYVKATSKVDTTKSSDPFEVEIIMPYIDSDLVWYNDGSNWYSIDQLQLIEAETPSYLATKLVDGTAITINKSDTFTNKIFIGRKVHVIQNNFMAKFTGFNGEIDFETKYDVDGTTVLNSKNNVTYILDGFLEECSSFNKKLNLQDIKYIGDSFLFGCSAFDNGSNTLDLSKNNSLQSIGTNFLGNCYHFNQEIKLPSGSLTSIGEFFLFNCVRFNSALNLPSTITNVDPFFMLQCYSFTNTITVECDISAFKGNNAQICSSSEKWDDPETEAIESYDAEIYKTGFTVAGTKIQEFKTRFPTIGSDLIWRKIKN